MHFSCVSVYPLRSYRLGVLDPARYEVRLGLVFQWLVVEIPPAIGQGGGARNLIVELIRVNDVDKFASALPLVGVGESLGEDVRGHGV